MIKLTIASESEPTMAQHRIPCVDCPWRRKAIPGWLGALSAQEWLAEAHGEARIDCHTLKKAYWPKEQWQCAGAAIFRGHVCKLPKHPLALQLPPNKKVFRGDSEFLAHHAKIKSV